MSSCSVKLSSIVNNKIGLVPNKENSTIIYDFYTYMQEKGSSENHQVNNLKVVSLKWNSEFLSHMLKKEEFRCSSRLWLYFLKIFNFL
jgi:hypothetical protein